jgi:hypothetical protein
LKLRNRANRENGSHAYLNFPGICKRESSVLTFREPNRTNLTRNGIHELDLRSITRSEVVLFINSYLFLTQFVLKGFPLYQRPKWAKVFRGDQCGREGILGDRGAFLLQLMVNRIDPVSPMITSHRDCGAPLCCSYPVVKGEPGDYTIVEDAQKRFGPALCEKMVGRCVCCANVNHGAGQPCNCCLFCDASQKEQFSHLGLKVENAPAALPDFPVFVRDVFETESDDGFETDDVNNN